MRRRAALAVVPWACVVSVLVPIPASAQADHDADAYSHPAPSTPSGPVGLATKPWIDDVDRAVAPPKWSKQQPLVITAAPGEVEPATFVVYARRNVRRLDVRVSELRGRGGRISASTATVREVLRVSTRRLFSRPETEVEGRFLPLLEAGPLTGGEFREVWLELAVPSAARPGVYEARIAIDVDGHEIIRRLRLRVRPMTLREPAEKALGMSYHAFANIQNDPERVRRELRDIRDHGVAHLLTDLRPTFRRDGTGKITIDVSRVSRALDVMVDEGFTGTVVVDSGLVPLARTLGHEDVAYEDAKGASLEGDNGAAFRRYARATLRALAAEGRARPRIQLAVKHLDEIFGRDRLDLFVELATVSRRVPELPVFAAMSTMTEAEDAMRARVDPLVDIRANHGYTFEWWLARGNDWNDYARELGESGDRGWFYHNQHGTYFTPRWARLINGIYLWAGPFQAHFTWVYQKFDGNPLDDTDGTVHDFGVSFPDPADGRVLIPTRSWAAIREGWDDLRYLETLRVALERHGATAPNAAEAARAFLDRLRVDVLRSPGAIDASRLRSRMRTPDEAPYVQALAQRYDSAALGSLRARVEELVVALETERSGARKRRR